MPTKRRKWSTPRTAHEAEQLRRAVAELDVEVAAHGEAVKAAVASGTFDHALRVKTVRVAGAIIAAVAAQRRYRQRLLRAEKAKR